MPQRPSPITWSVAGASLVGPAHRRAGQANQDAWSGWSWDGGGLVVVSDGMGSRPSARAGALAACTAVRRACRRWLSVSGAPIALLLEMIHLEWQLLLCPLPPRDCAATCLLALASGDRLILAQLGDGLVVARLKDGIERLRPSSTDFTNETIALGAAPTPLPWQVRTFDARHTGPVLLATDGVSEELVESQLGELLDWLAVELAPLPRAARWRRLQQELRALDAPGRIDDRTLALLYPTPLEAPR